MARIEYSGHLKLRLKIRKIPEDYPKKIYENPEQKFFDNAEQRFIAIKKLYYNKKMRNMMIAYEKKQDLAEIVTIHPITDDTEAEIYFKVIITLNSQHWQSCRNCS